MSTNPLKQPPNPTEQEAPASEAPPTETPPTKDPQKAAGSVNPREKAPFYEAVVQKGKRKRTW